MLGNFQHFIIIMCSWGLKSVQPSIPLFPPFSFPPSLSPCMPLPLRLSVPPLTNRLDNDKGSLNSVIWLCCISNFFKNVLCWLGSTLRTTLFSEQLRRVERFIIDFYYKVARAWVACLKWVNCTAKILLFLPNAFNVYHVANKKSVH